MKEVALYLDVLRQRRGMTQADLATQLKVELRQVQRWLSEGQPLKLETAQKIAKILKASGADIFRLLEDDATPMLSRDLASRLLGTELLNQINQQAQQVVELDQDIAAIAGYLKDHPELVSPVKSFVGGVDPKQKRVRKR